MHFSTYNAIQSCSLLAKDLDHTSDDWKLCAVGYVSGKFPGYRALNNIIGNTWKCEATLTIHESGWLVYTFQNEEDKLSVLYGGSYLVYGQPLILMVEIFCSHSRFFTLGEILKQINHSIIALVLKSTNANSAADYRPISCCNVTYKVISKILAGQLAHVLNDIISPCHNAFLGGCYMTDNINLMQELFRQYGRKRISPRCIIKIDFRKAFNSVQ